MREKQKVFKSIPELDAEIRFIENPDDKEDYYIVEVGLYESIGEQGENITFFYDNTPTEKEIIEDTKQSLIETLEDLRDKSLSAREEIYLEILERLEAIK